MGIPLVLSLLINPKALRLLQQQVSLIRCRDSWRSTLWVKAGYMCSRAALCLRVFGLHFLPLLSDRERSAFLAVWRAAKRNTTSRLQRILWDILETTAHYPGQVTVYWGDSLSVTTEGGGHDSKAITAATDFMTTDNALGVVVEDGSINSDNEARWQPEALTVSL